MNIKHKIEKFDERVVILETEDVDNSRKYITTIHDNTKLDKGKQGGYKIINRFEGETTEQGNWTDEISDSFEEAIRVMKEANEDALREVE